MTRLKIVLSFCVVASCATFPEVDDRVGSGAQDLPYPQLAPLDDALGKAGNPRIDDDTIRTLQDRVKALRQKAKRLRRPALTRAERETLQTAVADNPL